MAGRRPRLGVVTASLLLVACSGGSAGDGVATYEPAGPGGFDAVLPATLAVEGGCVYARSREFDERWLPIFPAGSVRWDGETLVFRGADYEDGDPIDLPGGAATEPTTPVPVPEDYDIPEPCSLEYVWLVTPD